MDGNYSLLHKLLSSIIIHILQLPSTSCNYSPLHKLLISNYSPLHKRLLSNYSPFRKLLHSTSMSGIYKINVNLRNNEV